MNSIWMMNLETLYPPSQRPLQISGHSSHQLQTNQYLWATNITLKDSRHSTGMWKRHANNLVNKSFRTLHFIWFPGDYYVNMWEHSVRCHDLTCSTEEHKCTFCPFFSANVFHVCSFSHRWCSALSQYFWIMCLIASSLPVLHHSKGKHNLKAYFLLTMTDVVQHEYTIFCQSLKGFGYFTWEMSVCGRLFHFKLINVCFS